MKFLITGGKKLDGEIDVLGSKNAALPIIAATLLSEEEIILENIPLIGDVFAMLDILKSMGSKQRWLAERTLSVKNNEIEPGKINQSLVNKIRASVLLIGPLLAKFGSAKIHSPGGCHIGARPLDAHLKAFGDAGAEIDFDERTNLYNLRLPKVTCSTITLKEQSVTATENLMMFFSLFPGKAEIRLSAVEPHVVDLGKFLMNLGVGARGLGTTTIRIKGEKKLTSKNVRHSIVADYIEAGTFLVLAAVTNSKIGIRNFPATHLESVLQKAKDFGVKYLFKDSLFIVEPSLLKASYVKTQPHPGFPTDLQSLFGLLATQAKGESVIFDTLYEGRLKYVEELKKMGAQAKILDLHRAIVFGPTGLRGAEIESPDLRAGALLVIAALAANGSSVLHNIKQIDRGYERLEERLRILGADIRRVE